jgi:sugar phosphate isomerase/epimerase
MSISYYFGSSSKVWEDISWIYGIEEAGYSGWEICADGSYHFGKRDQYERIIETLQSTTLKATVHAPFGDLNPAAINDPIWRETVRQLCECVRLASEITNRVTIHPGYLSCTGKLVPGKIWQLQKEAMKEVGKTATEYGVVACLENMPDIHDFLCRYPEEIQGIIEDIEGVSMTIDFGHAHTMGKVKDFIKVLKSASHVHIHDNNGKSDEHLAIGEGTVDWNLLSKTLLRDYRGVVVVEGRSIPEAKLSLSRIRGWR